MIFEPLRRLKSVFGRSSAALMIIGIGAGLSASSYFLLARVLPPSGLGIFGMVISAVMYLAMICSFGNGSLYYRFLPLEVGKGTAEVDRYRGFWAWSGRATWTLTKYSIVILSTIVLLLALLGVGPAPVQLFAGGVLASILLVLSAQEFRYAALARVSRHLLLALTPRQTAKPLVSVSIILAIVLLNTQINWLGALAVEVLAMTAAISIHLSARVEQPKAAFHDATSSAKVTWGGDSKRQSFASMSQQWMSSLDTILVGVVFGPAIAGIYLLGGQVSKVLALGNRAVAEIVLPHVARLHEMGDRPGLSALMKKASRQSIGFSCALSAVLLVLILSLDSIIPESYSDSKIAAIVLAAGQLVNAFTGPVGMCLNLIGLSVAHAKINIAGSVILIAALLVVSTISHTALGAALAVSMVIAGTSLAKSALFYRHTRVAVLPF